MASVRAPSLCTSPVVRRGNESAEWGPTRCGRQSHPRRRHVHNEQVVGLHPAGPPGGGRRGRAERSGSATTAGTGRGQKGGIPSGGSRGRREGKIWRYGGGREERRKIFLPCPPKPSEGPRRKGPAA